MHELKICILFILGTSLNSISQTNYVFESEFHFTGDTNIVIHQVIDDGSGGYYAQGFITDSISRTSNFNIMGMIMRFSCDGSLLWCRSISKSFNGSNEITTDSKNHNYNKIITTSSGDLLLLDNFHNISISRFSNNGALINSKRMYYGADTTYHLLDVKEIPNGEFVITGYVRLTNSSRRPKYSFLFLLDTNLNNKWGFTDFGQLLGSDNVHSLNPLKLFKNKIYVVLDNKDESIGIKCVDLSGSIVFHKNYSDNFFWHRAAIYDNSKTLLLVNSHFNINSVNGMRMRIIEHITGEVKLDKTIYNHSILPQNNTSVAEGFVEPPSAFYSSNKNKWIFTGYESIVEQQIYDFGNPFYMEFDDSLNLISALRYGTPYDHFNVDSIVAEGSIDLHESHWNMPLTRRKLGENYFSFFKRAGVMMTDKSFNNISCLNYIELTDSMRYFIPRSKTVKKSVERRGAGPRFDDHTLSGDFLHPVWKYNCFEKGNINANIALNNQSLCPNIPIMLKSLSNQYVTDWHWYVDDNLKGIDSSLIMTFDLPGKYKIELVLSDGCFEATTEIMIQINPLDTVFLNELLCRGDTLYWNNQLILEEGDYEFHSTNTNKCDSFTSLHVQIEEYFTTVDTSLCVGEIFELDGVDIISDTIVVQQLTSIQACDSLVQYTVQFVEDCGKCKLQIPLAFTPNGDNLNDQFELINPCNLSFTDYSIQIYSRWGELVFRSDNPKINWAGNFKGKPAISDIYLIHINGNLVRGGRVVFKKDITLIR